MHCLAAIGDTPEHLANHAESGCCVCLSKDAAGMHWLRLYQAATLQEVGNIASISYADADAAAACSLLASGAALSYTAEIGTPASLSILTAPGIMH